MNVILSNPIISEFLSAYPSEKHTNCLLGIILFGIYNLRSLNIDFSKILSQIESQPKPTSSFLARVQNSVKDEPGDTPRFTSEDRSEHKSLSFSNLKEKRTNKTRGHMKTPSIVNPEIITEYTSVENSEVLRIADQFLNGQFVNEYCKFERKPGKAPVLQGKPIKVLEKNENLCSESRRNNASLSLSGRRNSFSVVSGNRSIRGDRSTSYSKFW